MESGGEGTLGGGEMTRWGESQMGEGSGGNKGKVEQVMSESILDEYDIYTAAERAGENTKD